MPPIPKFPGLRQIIKDAGAALTREGTESIAAKTMTAEEKAYLDMIRQQMAEQEAFKAEFDVNPTVYHGSPHSEIKEFIPSTTGLHGEGIYTTSVPELANVYAEGHWGMNPSLRPKNPQGTIYPLKYRGRTFDVDNPQDWLDLIRVKNPSYSYPDIQFKKNWYTHKDIQPQLSAIGDLDKALKESNIFTAYKDNDLIKLIHPENVRGQFAEYDPLKRKSKDFMSGLAGATGLGATALGASEAKADTIDKQVATEELEYPRDPRAQPNVDPQALKQSLTDFLGNFAVVAPKGQQEGVEPSELSPIDFISPGMVTGLGKEAASLGSKALRSDILRKMMGKPRLVSPTEILPATKKSSVMLP